MAEIELGHRVCLARQPGGDAGTVRQIITIANRNNLRRALVRWDSDGCEQFVDLDKLAPSARRAPKVEHCTGCGEPAHPTETDDDGYHAGCRPEGV